MTNNYTVAELDSIGINCHLIGTPEEYHTAIPLNHNFKVITYNIRSINKNFDSFIVTLHRLKTSFDVIVFTECWLDENTVVPHLPSYTYYFTKKKINQNSGVIEYVRETLGVCVSEPELQDANCLQLTLDKGITILGVYRPPSFLNFSNFFSSLDQVLKSISNRNTRLILLGDINIDLLLSTSTQDLVYQCLTSEHGLFPAITKPTRGNRCLDHIFVNTTQGTTGVVCSSDVTDHYIAILGMATTKNPETNCNRNVLTRDVEAIKKELLHEDWAALLDNVDINQARNKRKRSEDLSNEIVEMRKEMAQMLTLMKSVDSNQKQFMERITVDMTSIKEKMSDIKSTISAITTEQVAMNSDIITLRNKENILQKSIDKMQLKVEKLTSAGSQPADIPEPVSTNKEDRNAADKLEVIKNNKILMSGTYKHDEIGKVYQRQKRPTKVCFNSTDAAKTKSPTQMLRFRSVYMNK
ncbi:unnamed protein product [Arctia plantaginis]|uniref:Endonuclease/exonuclease/phosphatase domain-containing protein n=1 Tax=Arctia plantaginis TaxID=874455 RepID=A0A8S1B6K6_ARCPL|nr:unnamed protein product [Arctia plantaginis]